MALLGALASARRTLWATLSSMAAPYTRYCDEEECDAIQALRYDAIRQEVTFRRSFERVERIEGVDKFLEYLETECILDHWDSRRLSGLRPRSFWFELRKQATMVYRKTEQSECLVFEKRVAHAKEE